jgi:putative transposase
MPNHYHFILTQQSGGSISDFLRIVFNAYTQAFNKENSHTGTIFEGRAKKILVDTDRYVLSLVNYIHLNPVVSSIVHDPEDWPYSSCRHWLGMTNDPLCCDEVRDRYFADSSEYGKYLREDQKTRKEIDLQKYIFLE